jgi:hypothetical protein
MIFSWMGGERKQKLPASDGKLATAPYVKLT